MLLLLTLVYVFRDFQSLAAPLTNLLAESSSDATRLVKTVLVAVLVPF